MQGFLKEFKDFAMRGNVLDLAVGIIIGGAFGQIVNSLVKDILMPPIGLVLGGVDFSELSIVLQKAAGDDPEVAINYGLFINNIINFIIVAFAIFIVIKQMNRLKREGEPEVAPTTKECPHCLEAVPLKATRCKFCTSELEGPADAA